jgi:MoxR-like ATPase
MGTADIIRAREAVTHVYVDDRIKDYIVSIVQASRRPAEFKLDIGPLVQYGASPRATIFMTMASKAHAFVRGRGYVTPEDVKAIGPDVLRHRVILTYEAEAEEVTPEEVVRRIFDAVEVP